jgi:hypothetical protein
MIEHESVITVPHASKTNRLSIVTLALAAVALAGFVFGGVAVIAVFAVGAGQVALQQISRKGERGSGLAIVDMASPSMPWSTRSTFGSFSPYRVASRHVGPVRVRLADGQFRVLS